MKTRLKSRLVKAIAALTVTLACAVPASAQSIFDPKPIATQANESALPAAAVDALNIQVGLLGGAFQRNELGTASNFMATTSISTPIPSFTNWGIQTDLAAGVYDGDFTSAASALHIFWRDPSVGMIGIYGDWAYVNPEHAGRVGVEFAAYNGPWSLDAFAGIQFGQNVFTRFVDEVDLSYYFTENFRGSVGHRHTARGHVGNISFEAMLPETGVDGLSFFGELEFGEDNYTGGFAGLRYAFGDTGASLMDRDRQSNVRVRIPRNLSSVTQCGSLDVPLEATSLRTELSDLCASQEEIEDRSSTGIEKF